MRITAGVLTVLSLSIVTGSALGDCNGNGLGDATEIEDGSSEDCNGNGIPDECDVAPIPYRAQQGALAVAKFPRVIRAADVDGDGDVDLVTGIQDTNRLSMVSLLWNGEEGFSETVFDAGSRLFSLTARDLDGDGDLDLATANVTTVLVLRNDGGTTFASPVGYAVQEETRFVTTAELTGDQRPDLVTVNSVDDSISVFRNQGDGTFDRAQKFPLGSYPNAAVGADFDGDGDDDLAVSNRNSGTVSIVLNDGRGAFFEAVEYETALVRPFTLLARDLNSDGVIDLAVAAGGGVSILMNAGEAAFPTPRSFALTGTVNSLSAADLEGDGDMDLAAGLKWLDEVILIRNDGTESFRASVRGQGDIGRSTAVLARDLDADGDAELVTIAGRDVTVIWHADEQEATFLSERFRADGEPHTVSIGDLDGDGDLDVVTGNNLEGISVIRNHGEGTFQRPEKFYLKGRSFSIVAVDLDGDRDLDLATTELQGAVVRVLLNHGDATYALPLRFRAGQGPFHLTAADLNDDGAPELITSNVSADTVSILFNQGAGMFGDSRNIEVGSQPMSAAAADYDGDGDVDVAVANTGSSEISLLLNDGGGSLALAVNLQLPGAPNSIVSADLDSDGWVDLVTANQAARSVSFVWNTGDPMALLASAVSFGIEQSPFSLLTADTDGDGDLDVVTADLTDDTMSIVLNQGGRLFGVAPPLAVGNEPRFAVAGDLDSDGDVDLVSANHADRDIMVFLNQLSTLAGDYLEKICTAADFYKISVLGGEGVDRVAKYVVPARDDPALLGTVFQDVRCFPLHEEFLAAAFPDRFGALTAAEYDELVGRRGTRDYFVGTVARVRTVAGLVYAFTVVADTGFDPREVLRLEEVERVFDTLSAALTLRPLVYEPDTQVAREKAAAWVNPPFEVFLGERRTDLEYEAYTQATGYGRVRLLKLAEFEVANRNGRFTFQDVLVVDQAPRDIEGVVAGVITGEIQGELSHVAIRTARRGTPNAFVANALEVFTPLAGKLVRLEVFETEHFATEVPLEEAEQFWASNRPRLAKPPGLDAQYRQLDSLAEMDLSGEASPLSRFGGKATNLARLQRLLDDEYEKYRLQGFAIPVSWYVDFMRTNTRLVGGVEQTYEEYLADLLASGEFQSDSQRRFETLEKFRDFVRENGVVDSGLVEGLSRRVEEVFGSRTRMLRFRSSSNVEDALEFNGAGLYESTSVCLADTLDEDDEGPSHCDQQRQNERTIERALKKVWASLWTFRAHEERTFFQIPAERTAMGILVNRAFLDEVANGVAFTGNPGNVRDRRYVVTAQVGEVSVVSPEPGTSVEKTLLEVVDGEVVQILRERGSSLLEPGENVLTDEKLHELGRLMAHIDQNFLLEIGDYDRHQVLLDFEFKVEPDGSLAVKQVRPFLLSERARPSPVFELEIPPGTEVCGVFSRERTGRTPRVEYDSKSRVRLVEGTFELPTAADSFSAELFSEVLFGSEQAVAEPAGPGLFRVFRIAAAGSQTMYRFNYEQEFQLPGAEGLDLKVFGLNFRGRGDVPLDGKLILDEQYLTSTLVMQGVLDGNPVVSYSSSSYELLPRWEVDVDLGGGSRIHLVERFQPSPNDVSTGPAGLMRATLELEGVRRDVADYWNLVYAARRHNRNVRYWVELEPPLVLDSLEKPLRVVEIAAPEPPSSPEPHVMYLGVDLEELGVAQIVSYDKRAVPERSEGRFRRGDVDSDGVVNIGDALSLLSYVFQRGVKPGCQKSADANDDGKLNVSDALALLLHLFGNRGPLPEPSACGLDPSADGLRCEVYRDCD